MSRSQSMKDLIEQNHQQIAEAEREIGRLTALDRRLIRGQTPYGALKATIPEKITVLRRQIEALRSGIVAMQGQLPMIEMVERAEANINTRFEAEEREREAARIAERDATMKEAARQRYLQSGGNSVHFESVWPSIRQGIAEQNARVAAETALQAPTTGDRSRAVAQSYLAARYRQPVKGDNDGN